MVEHQIHFGKKFCINKIKGYWVNTQSPDIYAHRWVWQHYHGEIPEGFHIHHRDGNKSNNSIENLEIIEAGLHSKLHNGTEEARHRQRKICERLGPVFLDWRTNPVYKERRSEKAKKGWRNRKSSIINCKHCRKETVTFSTGRKTFCSKACCSKWRNANEMRDKRNCACCSKEFLASRSSVTRFCSPSCSAKVQWARNVFKNRNKKKAHTQLLLTL